MAANVLLGGIEQQSHLLLCEPDLVFGHVNLDGQRDLAIARLEQDNLGSTHGRLLSRRMPNDTHVCKRTPARIMKTPSVRNIPAPNHPENRIATEHGV